MRIHYIYFAECKLSLWTTMTTHAARAGGRACCAVSYECLAKPKGII